MALESPFTKKIQDLVLSMKFKMPQMTFYKGKFDLISHTKFYKEMMSIQSSSKLQMCRLFPLTLEGQAKKWYRSLKPRTFGSFA